VTEDRGSIPEREPEKRLPLLRKAAGAQITQSRPGEVVTINNDAGLDESLAIGMSAVQTPPRGSGSFTLKKSERSKRAELIRRRTRQHGITERDPVPVFVGSRGSGNDRRGRSGASVFNRQR